MQSSKVDRDMLFFSTKAGFLDSAALNKLLSRSVISQSDVVGGANCIHAACLEASLQTSLHDMHLEMVRQPAHLMACLAAATVSLEVPCNINACQWSIS